MPTELDIDYLLVGGHVVAGDGQADPFVGTVAIGREQVLWMRPSVVDAPAHRRLDCSGLIVAPGFIDIHTHSDAALLEDSRAQSQVSQGVTTEIAGNCGANTCGAPHATRVMTFQYGTSSEQLGAQLTLVPAEPPQTAPAAEPPKNKQGRKAGRKPRELPAHLPRGTQVHDPKGHRGDAPCACGGCGGKLRQLGEDVSEQLEYRVQRALCAAHAAGAVARLASCTATSAFRLSIRRTTA